MPICVCGTEWHEVHGVTECPLCYGHDEALTIVQISEVLDMSISEVRKLEKSAFMKLYMLIDEAFIDFEGEL